MSMTLNRVDLEIANRASIDLEELQQTASFLVRKDRKYIVPIRSLGTVLDRIDADARVLEIEGQRTFAYESLYFDTTDLRSYFGALRQRPDRFKVRVRVYKDSGLTYLEAKTRDHHGRTVKHRLDREGCVAPELAAPEHQWLQHFDEIGSAATSLTHMLTTRYSRSTIVLPHGEGRLTIDHGLEFATPNGESLSIPSVVILESKGPGHPTSVDQVLWRCGLRPVSISKFGCGMSLLSSNLPSNRWHRIRNQLANAVG